MIKQALDTVKAIFDKQNAGWSEDFSKGFELCYQYILTGLYRHSSFNTHLEIYRLRKELSTLKNDKNGEVMSLVREVQKLEKEKREAAVKSAEQIGVLTKKLASLKDLVKLESGEESERVKKLVDQLLNKDLAIKAKNAEISSLHVLLNQLNSKPQNLAQAEHKIEQLKERNKQLCNKVHDELYKDNQFAKVDQQFKALQRCANHMKGFVNSYFNGKKDFDLPEKVNELYADYNQELDRIERAYNATSAKVIEV